VQLSEVQRSSGESYFDHGNNIVNTLREITQDPVLLSAALCHDILVLRGGKQILNHSPLTPEERTLALGMHRLRHLHIDKNTRDLDRVIQSFGNDSRLLILRMAHRLVDVRNIQKFPVTRQRQIARETLHMYTAIASRLGFHRWRYEMEDACFTILHPKRAAALEAEYAKMSAIDRICIDRTTAFLEEKLRAAGIRATISDRIKGLYSTYRKMVTKRRAFHELSDRIAIRIVVANRDDCYRALGIVHSCMHPVPGKLKDYIGAPKENGYRSIHTVVWPLPGVTDQPLEIQIRTEEMDRECDLGIASHGEYKLLNYAFKSTGTAVELWRNLQTLRAEAQSPAQFEKALRSYFSESHMAIFDAKGNIHHIARPATARDFIRSIESKPQKRIGQVRINGRKRSASTELRDGDCVE
jgi:(p)ppGpp synthase/HD superfamily hydrolase